MSDLGDFDFSSVPDWVRKALASTVKSEASKSAVAYHDQAVWPLLLEAALVKTFLPRDLAPGAVKRDERKEAEKVVLNFAETTRTSDGQFEWSLKDDTRVEVIKAANTDDLTKAIDRTSQEFSDEVSRAIRNCLTMSPAFTQSLDLKSLEATRIAVSALTGLSVELPKIDQLDREIEFRRLLRVFERMIGRRREADGTETVERFYGRDDEIEKLRDYVGVIPADSFAGATVRAFNWLSRSIHGRAPMAVWGVGGVGKTTLISKFMLEHAEAAVSRYPFAYLDFDRNTISARRPSALLMEMCLQVGSQFQELTHPMAELRARVSEVARKFEVSQEFESTSLLATFTQEFRDLVDNFLTNEERLLEWARPFLLVFDTFEVVQYAADDVVNLQDFVSGFSRPDEKRMWNRLRLIISGRKQVTHFLAPVESLPLGALDVDGSADMLIALADDAQKPISKDDAGKLVAAIAKATEESGGGVQPLRLRLIGTVFEKEEKVHDGPAIVKSLVEELSKPLKSGGLAAQVLIDGVLIRRVLSHVGDYRVKALADPGLVVRRITPDVIKEVMTRGTTKPSPIALEVAVGAEVSKSPDVPDDSDLDPVEPWIVNDQEAQDIFDAFAKEGTLVEPDESVSGDEPAGAALRHRADVRQQMLPLIKARSPNRFNTIHRLAFKHFLGDVEAKRKKKQKEIASAGEAIYHGLCLNEPLKTLDALWIDSASFDPKIDADEFRPGSEANVYLRAKSGSKLEASEVSKLPRAIALSWLNNRSAALLDERRIEDAITVVRAAAGEDFDALGDNVASAAVLARLLYRSGRWDESHRLASRYLKDAGPDDLVGGSEEKERQRNAKGESKAASLFSLLRTSLTIEAKSGVAGPAYDRVLDPASPLEDSLALVELCAYAVLTEPHDTATQPGRDGFKTRILDAAASVGPDRWKPEQRILRLAVLATDGAPDLMHRWFELRERVPREASAATVIEMLTVILSGRRTLSDLRSLEKDLYSPLTRGHAWNKVDELWRREKRIIMEALHNGELLHAFKALLAHEHSDWLRPLGNSLTRALLVEGEGDMLIAMLDKNEFWKRKTRQKQGRSHDGVGVVQAAADEGRLLELASSLEPAKKMARKSKSSPVSMYPEDVVEVAAAFGKWHATTFERFTRPSENA